MAPSCSFIPFALILSVYSLYKDLRCSLVLYKMNIMTHIFKPFVRQSLLSLKKFHFLICSIWWPFLYFTPSQYSLLLTKVPSLSFFGHLFIRLSLFHFTTSFLMSFNHILNLPHIPHQKVAYLFPPLLLKKINK